MGRVDAPVPSGPEQFPEDLVRNSAPKVLVVILALVGASFAVNVSVTSPGNGATVGSPTTINAYASSGYPITGWRIYVDGNSVYQAGMTSNISASVAMATGTHQVVVSAWDSTGAYGSVTLTLTVSGTASGVSVYISSPANGAMVGSPATINASASSGLAITGWRIYVDNNNVYSAGATTGISAAVSMAAGWHQIVVRAWNSSGAYGSGTISVNISGTSGGTAPSTGGPTPPSYATKYSNLENMYPTGKCSSPTCSGGVGSVWNYYAAPYQTSPSLDGASSVFYIDGPAYTTDLFWYKMGTNTGASHFITDFWVYTDGNTPSHAEALEFDLIQVTNGLKYNWSSQCNYWTKTWDTWNEATLLWVHSNAVCQPLSPNTWHHVSWAVERVGGQTHYLSVTVDGVTQYISSSYAWLPALATNWSNGALTFQVQQDLSSAGGSYTIWVDKANVYAW